MFEWAKGLFTPKDDEAEAVINKQKEEEQLELEERNKKYARGASSDNGDGGGD
ncbi:hypothetical protein L4D77_03810 [Photobacterium frigidiphilum]|uniref:hypothetical protein n=1 Tax=Photobacterium frigidiphilum TaxID=264736 RepID=UPI001474DBD0|nr:hypothetical protein [Photobacterium frigidiphilum]